MKLIYWRIIRRPRSLLRNGARAPRLDVDQISCGSLSHVVQDPQIAARYKGFVRVWDITGEKDGAQSPARNSMAIERFSAFCAPPRRVQ